MHKINSQIDKVTDRLDVDGEILGSYWNISYYSKTQV